jgi:hypothetical protein
MPLDLNNWRRVPDQQDHPTSQIQWGHLNSKIYVIHSHSAQELKDHVKEGIGRINGILLQLILRMFKDTLRMCINLTEALLNILFKKNS